MLLWVLALFLANAQAEKVNISISTDTWAPYVNPQGEPYGIAANVVSLLAKNAQVNLEWDYTPYEMSYFLLKNKKITLAFPYFKTKQRSGEVLYSDPIFSVSSYLYYNQQYLPEESLSTLDLSSLKIGRVSGYSYGDTLDKVVMKAELFNSEEQALLALLNNKIDVLPMTEEVMTTTLQHNFPERLHLIKKLSKYKDDASLYLIASDSEEGRQALLHFNNSLVELREAGIRNLQPLQSESNRSVDLATLRTSEGYPAIIGKAQNERREILYYSLPVGTRVIVLEWSKKISQPSSSDRLYKTMMDSSKVVILNGPHVGLVLNVRNMHIELL